MKRWEVTFEGDLTGKDADVTMNGKAIVEAEDAAKAREAGLKAILGINECLADVDWDHVRTIEVEL